MPLIQYSNLPTFERLIEEGRAILPEGRALNQDIRELHVGFLNMMADPALEATERQFYRLISESNPVAQIYIHPFTLDELGRQGKAKDYTNEHYQSFDDIKKNGLDALILTGINVQNPNLEEEAFWHPLKDIMDWAWDNVTSTLCSCLATHAVMQLRYGQERQPLPQKKLGVFKHRVIDRTHPLVRGMNTVFDVVHSRYNEISRAQFEQAQMKILVESMDGDVHMATSPDGFRLVCFQGHPEYDTVSLLKEYRRDLSWFYDGTLTEEPDIPVNYFGRDAEKLINQFKEERQSDPKKPFPENDITPLVENSWADSARTVISSWIGQVYQTTHVDRRKLFMDGINPDNPLNL